MFSRRNFLKGTGLAIAAAGLTPLFFRNKLSEPDKSRSPTEWFVSCGSDEAGNYYGIACTENGALVSKVKLPGRGNCSYSVGKITHKLSSFFPNQI